MSAFPLVEPPPGPACEDDGRCYHCGLPNPAGGRWRGSFAGAMRTFCCAGCLGIAQTLHCAGLEAFYAQRAAAGNRPVDGDEDRFRAWDEPVAQVGVVRTTPRGDAEASLLLEGMHCGACTWLIETWLGREPGVLSASVNYATRRAHVVWDPDRRQLSDLLRAVARIGYAAHPYDPDHREALARRESRSLLLRMAVALLAMMQVMMFAVPTYVSIEGVEPIHEALLQWASLTLTLPVLLYCAWPFFRGALRDLGLHRAGMDVPIALGLLTAFTASFWATVQGTGAVYYDSITMFIALLLVARYVELRARRRAGDAVESIARAQPATAERIAGWPASREAENVTAASLASGDIVLVRPGGIVPADGVVAEGAADVEEAMLTGEARPARKQVGSTVLAGSVARDGALTVRVTAAGEATRLAAVERLVDRAAGERPRIARVADRAAAWFVAALLAIALATALVWTWVDPAHAVAITFAVLAVSCPCALSLATPAALAAAAGALSRRHVVIARTDALETMSKVTHVVFDKTGTLTTGRLRLGAIETRPGVDRNDALALAAGLEATSEHPLARAFRDASRGSACASLDAIVTYPGEGVEALDAGRRLRLGRRSFVAALCATPWAGEADAPETSTVVHLGDERGPIAAFAFTDEVRGGAGEAIAALHALRIHTVLLSGDRGPAVEAIRQTLGINEARADALPEDKREFIAALQSRGAVVAMVGDGINDAPGLAQAQVSLSLGSATPLAQWTADVVLLSDRLDAVADALRHARRTMRVVRENLAWAFAYNVVAIPAAAFGFVTPLLAALGMSVSSIVVVLNAMRAARMPAASGASDATAASAPALQGV